MLQKLLHQLCFPAAAAIILFATTAVGFAQGTLRGTVSDPLGVAVTGAKVTLHRGDGAVGDIASGSDGAYSFSISDSARYHLEVDAAGFAPYVGADLFVGSSGTTTADVFLQLSALKQEIVVSATGSEISVAQTGASVSLIDELDIKAQNKLDVLENLRQVSGVQIIQTSQRGGTTSLFIRGGESNFNKVMIDGAPANGIGGGFDYAQLSNGGVQSVEVLKGSNSVLYGADAMAGVVNVTTRRGTTALPQLDYSVDGGNFGTKNQAVSLGGAYRRFDYFSQFSRFDTRGSYQNSYFHNATYAGNFGFKPDAKTDLRVTLRRNWTDLGSPNGILLYGIADNSSNKVQNTYLTGTAQHQTTSRWHNTARFAFSQAASTYNNPSPSGIPQPFDFGNYLGNVMTIKGANGYSVTGQGILDYSGVYPSIYQAYEGRRSAYLQSDYRIYKEWTATGGFRYEHENGSGYIRNNYTYFMEGHGNVAHRLYLTAGVGVENNTVFGVAATPRVSAAYYLWQPASMSFFTTTKLKFNFGKGIKEPSTSAQGGQVYELLTPAQRAQYNVSPIGPERSRTVDFGIEQGLWNGRARFEVTYFDNRFYDLINYLNPAALISIGVSQGAVNLSGFGAYVNATSTKSKGAELQFLTELGHGLHFQANYTYLDPVVTKAFGAPSFNPAFPEIAIGAYSPVQGAQPFRRARNSGSFGLTYAHNKFTGTFTGSLIGRRDDSTFMSDPDFGNTMLLPNKGLAAAYQKFDLSGRYQLKRYISLYTSVENLFSQHYQAVFGFPAMPFTIRSGVTFTLGGESWRP